VFLLENNQFDEQTSRDIYAEDKTSNKFFEASEVSDIGETDSYNEEGLVRNESAAGFPDTGKKTLDIKRIDRIDGNYCTTELSDKPLTQQTEQ
jgi:hypothetical protein